MLTDIEIAQNAKMKDINKIDCIFPEIDYTIYYW